MNKANGGNWHVSKTKRSEFSPGKTLSVGPGSYDISNTRTLRTFNSRGSSSFISNALKSAALKEMGSKETAVPGPGQYNPSTGAFEHKQTSGAVQMFGKLTPRFIKEKSNLGPNIGPGKYGDFRQSYVLVLFDNPIESQPKKEVHTIPFK